MKKILFISLTLIGSFCSSQDYSSYDKINKENDLTINGIIVSGLSIQQVVNNFGEPDKIEDFFFEMENDNGYIYLYNDGLKLFIRDEFGLESFEVFGKNYLVTINHLKVGDPIERLKAIFPKSYNIGKYKGAISVMFNDADYYLAFMSKNQKITDINLYKF